MPWFKKAKKPKPVRTGNRRSSVPEGLWIKCQGCKEINTRNSTTMTAIYRLDLSKNCSLSKRSTFTTDC